MYPWDQWYQVEHSTHAQHLLLESHDVSLCSPSPFGEMCNKVGLFDHIVHSLVGYLTRINHHGEWVLRETAQSVKSFLHSLEGLSLIPSICVQARPCRT